MNCVVCGEPIDKHEACPKTDSCVKEGVMKWTYEYDMHDGGCWKDKDGNLKSDYVFVFFEPSISITDAWEVWQSFVPKPGRDDSICSKRTERFVEAIMDIHDADQNDSYCDVFNLLMAIRPISICHAALRAAS